MLRLNISGLTMEKFSSDIDRAMVHNITYIHDLAEVQKYIQTTWEKNTEDSPSSVQTDGLEPSNQVPVHTKPNQINVKSTFLTPQPTNIEMDMPNTKDIQKTSTVA